MVWDDPLKIPDGSNGNSVEYHIHKGKMFDRNDPETGRHVHGSYKCSNFINSFYSLPANVCGRNEPTRVKLTLEIIRFSSPLRLKLY
jgi:hypothetical protein